MWKRLQSNFNRDDQKVKQPRSEAGAIKARHPYASNTVDDRSGTYNILALLDINQSIERKHKLAADPERQDVPRETEEKKKL